MANAAQAPVDETPAEYYGDEPRMKGKIERVNRRRAKRAPKRHRRKHGR